MPRTSTTQGALARLGFGDPTSAERILGDWDDAHGDALRPLVDDLAASADPDLALSGLARLVEGNPGLLDRLIADETLTRRLVAVLGASVALNQHLGHHPGDVDVLAGSVARRSAAELRTELLAAAGADPAAPQPVAAATGADPLRLAYRRALLRLASRDLTSPDPLEQLPDIAGELADLADATIETALALARGEVAGWEGVRFGVVALGKTGAQELNYVSDVDVLYVAEPATDEAGEPRCTPQEAVTIGGKLAGALTRVCSAHTGAGTIWQVDAALRPEGKAGPLVRSLAGMATYYRSWAKNWEFQAMLKARPMAGDLALAREFCELVSPQVWRVAENDQFVAETQAMRKRVIALLPPKEADREIKLGAGGLRDVEFSVQLLQLVHGRADERIRVAGTLPGLARLIEHGYVGRSDGKDLDAAYRFLRLLEHRIQLSRLRRTHLMPDDQPSLRRLARSVGATDVDELTQQWRSATRRVLGLHRRLFYSPLLETVARIPSDAVTLTSEAAETRLRALGYADPKAALRHIQALSQGLSRQAEIQRQLLPAMLGWIAEGPNPDHGLLAFRQVSEAMGATHWYLRALRDGDAMAERLARILAASRYAVDLLMRAPQAVGMLDDRQAMEPRPMADIVAEMRLSAARHSGQERAVQHVRAVRRRELVRLAMSDLLGVIDLPRLGRALSEVMSATIQATLEIVLRDHPSAPRIAIVALGRWGGGELSYGSDADAMIVVEDSDDPDATKIAGQVIATLRAVLAKPGADPALEIDVDLRPEGKGGPIVRSASSYLAYYGRWASTWEAQALLRAAHGAGDPALTEALLTGVEGLRYPAGGLTKTQVGDIRKLKARMENERMPRGSDPKRHTKLGPGGLSDVEWVAQLIQLQHAHDVPPLRCTGTLEALAAAEAAGLLGAADHAALADAWTMASRLRNAIMLLRGRPSDGIPTDTRERAAVAEILGYAKGESSLMVEDYLRRTRLARQVMDRLFWGEE